MKGTFQCRSCGAPDGVLVLDLGVQPLANNLLRPEDLTKPEPTFPLRLFVCPTCWLLQITDLVPPVTLFTDYLYFSSFSDSMLAHARSAAERYQGEFSLGAESFVVEIASNDGYLLQHFQHADIRCLGIEPAANIAKVAQQKGIPTVVTFFGDASARKLQQEHGQADLVLGNNVFAHAPDPNDFVSGLQQVLKPHGRIVLEFPYAVDMLEGTEFDTIYHEHVFYFTLTALRPLFERHGLEIFNVERLPLHGGSLRIFVGHTNAYPERESVIALRNDESGKGFCALQPYERFARAVLGIRSDLRALVQDVLASGCSLGAYGASAKGSTLLNFCGLGHESISFVADRSPYKQGRLTPGTHIPVVAPEELLKQAPDYALLLTWNFAEEILRQQQAYRVQGGKFIIPIPKVTTV